MPDFKCKQCDDKSYYHETRSRFVNGEMSYFDRDGNQIKECKKCGGEMASILKEFTGPPTIITPLTHRKHMKINREINGDVKSIAKDTPKEIGRVEELIEVLNTSLKDGTYNDYFSFEPHDNNSKFKIMKNGNIILEPMRFRVSSIKFKFKRDYPHLVQTFYDLKSKLYTTPSFGLINEN